MNCNGSSCLVALSLIIPLIVVTPLDVLPYVYPQLLVELVSGGASEALIEVGLDALVDQRLDFGLVHESQLQAEHVA